MQQALEELEKLSESDLRAMLGALGLPVVKSKQGNAMTLYDATNPQFGSGMLRGARPDLCFTAGGALATPKGPAPAQQRSGSAAGSSLSGNIFCVCCKLPCCTASIAALCVRLRRCARC
jgi:hypothetical protein